MYNGSDFIDEAINNGASAIVVSRDILEKSVPVIRVDDTNLELRKISAKFYDYPCDNAYMIGVTGTNGKTTVAEIIYKLLGDTCAYIGTNGRKYKNKHFSMRNTTPDVDRLYMYFREFIDAGCNSISMEVSSESYYWHRLDDIKYDIGIVTNITEDHLNIHKTIDNYVDCKCQLVSHIKDDGYSILNSSDKYYNRFRMEAHGKIVSYGYRDSDTLKIENYTIKIPGDLNQDGTLSLTDLIPLQQSLLRQTTLTADQAQLADYNGEGSINVLDLMLLKRALLAL